MFPGMLKLRFLAQLKTKNGWFDEFWSYCPAEFYAAFNRAKSLSPNNWRVVLRVVEAKTFEQIKIEQGGG